MANLKIWKILRYIILNALFGGVIYYGFFENVSGARNVALFWGWVVALLGTFVWIVILVAREKMAEGIAQASFDNGSLGSVGSVPAWIDVVYDICVLAVFVWFGHYILGIFYFLQILGLFEVRKLPQEFTITQLRKK